MTPRAVLFTGAGEPLHLRPQATDPPAGAAIRVRVLCCTLCRSDLATFDGRRVEPTPTVLGHEVVGAIAAFGPAANRTDAAGVPAAVGDRVTWAVVASCGWCGPCRDGLEQKCDRGVKYGHHRTDPANPDGGGLADGVTLVPGTAWFRVPAGVTTPVAALANCAGATAAAVLDAAGPVAGRSVLVFGAGLLGLFACGLAAVAGANVVAAVDPDPAGRRRATQFGATHALDPTAGDFDQQWRAVAPRGADAALELAGRGEAVEGCLAAVRTGGTVVLAGTVSPTPPVPLDPQQVVRRMLTLRGVHNYRPAHLRAVLNFLAGPGRAFPFDTLIADTFPLDRAAAAFAAARTHPGRRVAVVP